jgi:uncharacterized coiled-coil DUF342 family protein
MSLKGRFDEDRAEFSELAERLHQLRADLDRAFKDAEDQRQLIAKLREEADEICELTFKVREAG